MALSGLDPVLEGIYNTVCLQGHGDR